MQIIKKFNDWRDTVPPESGQDEVTFVGSVDDLNFAPDSAGLYSISEKLIDYKGYVICGCKDLRTDRLWYEAITSDPGNEIISQYKFNYLGDCKNFINKVNNKPTCQNQN